MKKLLLFCSMLAAFAVTSCSKDEDMNIPSTEREPITIGLSTIGLSYEDLPTTRANDTENDLLAVQIYEVNSETQEETPYAKGLFADYSAISFKGYSNTIYKVEASMVVSGAEKIYKEDDVYGKPFEMAVVSEIEYNEEAIEGIASGNADLPYNNSSHKVFATPNIDRYFGYTSKIVTADNPSISVKLKRMTFGLKLPQSLQTLPANAFCNIQLAGAPSIIIKKEEAKDYIAIYSLSDLKVAYDADESEIPYSEEKKLNILAMAGQPKPVFSKEISFQRNKLVSADGDKLNGGLGFEFDTPFEDELTDNNDDGGLRILTFEDVDYKGSGNMLGNKDWSSLIDDPEYGTGGLLYGEEMFSSSIKLGKYEWYDEGNTELAHRFLGGSFGTIDYSGGGHAISNYVETDLSKGDYLRQLSVVVKDPVTGFGGCDGSKNFAMHYGYIDDSGYGMTSNLPQIYFMDDVARVIDHMYVAPNTYLANCVTNGNGLTAPLTNESYVNIVATGYNGDTKTGEVKFELANGDGFINKWTKWDLSSLGKVTYIEFNMTGDSDNGYGFSQPAYFAYDNVAVQF